MKPLFSIIIPTFNPGAQLALSLESIRAQNFADLEILVQDGASTDGTRQWLANQTDLNWCSEPDEGVYDAMNKAITRSRGRYLYFLGAGDTLRPDVLKQVARVLQTAATRDARPLILYGDVWFDDLKFVSGGRFTPWRMTVTCPNHQTMFTAREVFELKGNFNLKYPINADYAFHFACFGDARIRTVHLPLVIANYAGGGISANARDETFEADRTRLIWKNFPLPVKLLYRLRRASPRGLKTLGAPLLCLLGAMPDARVSKAAPPPQGKL